MLKKIKHIEKPLARQFNVLHTDVLFANPNAYILAHLTHNNNRRFVQSVQIAGVSFDEASERSQYDFV